MKFIKHPLKEQYVQDNRPWIVTFSDRKDSSTVLYLTFEVLLGLIKENKDTNAVHLVSSNAKVEMPLIDKYFLKKIEEIKNFIKKAQLNMKAQVVSPDSKDSFWSLLIMMKLYNKENREFLAS